MRTSPVLGIAVRSDQHSSNSASWSCEAELCLYHKEKETCVSTSLAPGPAANGTLGASPTANMELSGWLSPSSLLFQRASKLPLSEREHRPSAEMRKRVYKPEADTDQLFGFPYVLVGMAGSKELCDPRAHRPSLQKLSFSDPQS